MPNFNRQAAVQYAHDYCINRNLRYPYYGDDDCTNFVSQCWKKGGIPMTEQWHCHSSDDTTYDDTTGAWISVPDFAAYMLEQGVCYLSNDITQAELGDIVQLYNDESGWHHSVIITRIDKEFAGKILYYSGRSNSRYDEPLSGVSEQKRLLRVYAF